MILGMLFTLILLFANPQPAQATEFERASKLGLRINNSYLTNSAPGGGSALSYGGICIDGLFFPTQKIALGAQYQVDIDYGGNSSPLNGIGLVGRYYFSENGTRITEKTEKVTHEYSDPLAYYLGVIPSRKSYFSGNKNKTGSFIDISLEAGLEHPISRSIELNVALAGSILGFAESQKDAIIQSYALRIGVNFLW